MKRISVTGWTISGNVETDILDDCGLKPGEMRKRIRDGLWNIRPNPVAIKSKKVRVTVEIDVEELP